MGAAEKNQGRLSILVAEELFLQEKTESRGLQEIHDLSILVAEELFLQVPPTTWRN